jgi:hypothetical protein
LVTVVGKLEVDPFLAGLVAQDVTEEVRPVEAFAADSWVELSIARVEQGTVVGVGLKWEA